MGKCYCRITQKNPKICVKCGAFICQTCDRCRICVLFGGVYICRNCSVLGDCTCIAGKYKSGNRFIDTIPTEIPIIHIKEDKFKKINDFIEKFKLNL